MVGGLACAVKFQPFGIARPELLKHSQQPGPVCRLAITNLSNTSIVIAATLPVAHHEVWAEAVLVRAILILPVFDEAMEGTAARCHGNVRLVHFSTAFVMLILGLATLSVHVVTAANTLSVAVNTSHEARIGVAIQVLLVCLVLLLERCLDVPTKIARMASNALRMSSSNFQADRLVRQATPCG